MTAAIPNRTPWVITKKAIFLQYSLPAICVQQVFSKNSGGSSQQRQGRGAVTPMALLRGHERLPRKYVCGVVPSIVRNISMKALTLW
jgi:hypothetical protein